MLMSKQPIRFSTGITHAWCIWQYSVDWPGMKLRIVLRKHFCALSSGANSCGIEKPFVLRWQVIAAAIALMLVLFGAGMAGSPLSALLGGNQVAYAQVNQSQSKQDQGVTVTLVEAYASKAGTVIVVKTQVNGPKHAAYITAPQATLEYQHERIIAHQKLMQIEGTSVCQVYSAEALHPAANVSKVTVFWHVEGPVFSKTDVIKLNNQVYRRVLLGDAWQFHFTIPFHQDYSKPGSPVHC